MPTTTLDPFDDALGSRAFWDVVVYDAGLTNMRTGYLAACWDQSDDSTPAMIAESSSSDIGDTSDVAFTVNKSGSTVRLQYTHTGTWTIEAVRRLI